MLTDYVNNEEILAPKFHQAAKVRVLSVRYSRFINELKQMQKIPLSMFRNHPMKDFWLYIISSFPPSPLPQKKIKQTTTTTTKQ